MRSIFVVFSSRVAVLSTPDTLHVLFNLHDKIVSVDECSVTSAFSWTLFTNITFERDINLKLCSTIASSELFVFFLVLATLT